MLPTLSKFFNRSIILPSTSVFESPAGAEYHLKLEGRAKGVERVDLAERQGPVEREAGNWDRAASLHDRRQVRITVFRIIINCKAMD